MKNLFRINVFTYLFLTLSLLSGYFREIFIAYFILIVHELGHFFLMKLFDISVYSITLYPYGGMIKSSMLINTNSLKVLLISLGGIINQIILWLFIYIIFKFNILSGYYYEMFFKYNIYIIAFNLLPIYPLDGFKVLNSFFDLFFSFRKSIFFSLIINILFLIIFILYLYIFKISNYVIIIFLLVNLFNYFREIKYMLNKFFVERIIYDIKYSGLVSVNNVYDMFKNKYNYINGVNEKDYLLDKYCIFNIF